MPYVDSNGNIIEKPQGILQGFSFNGILNGILTFLMAIIAFFQSMIFPLLGHNVSSRVSRFFSRGSNDRRGGPGGGSGGGNGGNGGGGRGGNRPIGRLNTSTMDSPSCPTGGCSGGGCG
uniref:Glycine-rich protein n=1 Tax=Panagrolaimus davidi TaxID=227884 RepID=A0A914P6T1_9BILA